MDCASGSGNGPEYVAGPVYVVGNDIYELDRDGDGVACEN
ncbi:excalibur calcium-binding domain-containing protein [Mycolicibacterium agri]